MDWITFSSKELLIASVAQCHMLWYLHFCAVGGVTVVRYQDRAHGVMAMDARGGGGQIAEVTLRPEVTIGDESMTERAHALHAEVPAVCFIARSVNFPIHHQPVIRVSDT